MEIEYMPAIKYEIAKAITKKMLKARLITQEEFDRIDLKNKDKFAINVT